ncbi:MAG: hypothetical protein ABI559_08560 [Chloroflexota bacterium]
MGKVLFVVAVLAVFGLINADALHSSYAVGGINADIVVDDNLLDCVTANPSDAADFTTISAALASPNGMSPGIAIYVCPGTYTEPALFLNFHDMSLSGGATLSEPGETLVKKMQGSVSHMLAIAADRVTVSGFTWDAKPPLGGPSQTQGILGHGNDAVISNNIVKNTTYSLTGAIDIGPFLDTDPSPTGTQITGNQVSDVTGSYLIQCKCTTAEVSGNVLTGDQVFGVTVDGDGANVSNNLLTGAAIQVFGSGGSINLNSLTDSDIQSYGSNMTIDGNMLQGSNSVDDPEVLVTSAGDQNAISNNTMKNTTRGGLFLSAFNATTGSFSVVKNTFDHVLQPIEIFDGNPGDANLVTAAIGGSAAMRNVFLASGGTLADANYLVQLSGADGPISAEDNNWGLCNLAEIEEEIFHHPDDPALGTVDYDPFIGPDCPTPTATPPPTPTPSPATPTATPGDQIAFGDLNCDGHENGLDALLVFDHEAPQPAAACPAVATTVNVGGVQRLWGDLDCNGVVDLTDALALLRHEAGLDYDAPDGCPRIGDPVSVD